MPTVTFTTDAIVANRGFSADAWIVGNRLRHDRTLDHTGVETADVVVLSSDIGPYPAGTTVQVVLQSFASRLAALEQANRVFGFWRVDAFIRPYFYVNAIKRRSVSGSFTADAVVTIVGPHSFTANAVIFSPGSGSSHSFTVNAFLV